MMRASPSPAVTWGSFVGTSSQQLLSQSSAIVPTGASADAAFSGTRQNPRGPAAACARSRRSIQHSSQTIARAFAVLCSRCSYTRSRVLLIICGRACGRATAGIHCVSPRFPESVALPRQSPRARFSPSSRPPLVESQTHDSRIGRPLSRVSFVNLSIEEKS